MQSVRNQTQPAFRFVGLARMEHVLFLVLLCHSGAATQVGNHHEVEKSDQDGLITDWKDLIMPVIIIGGMLMAGIWGLCHQIKVHHHKDCDEGRAEATKCKKFGWVVFGLVIFTGLLYGIMILINHFTDKCKFDGDSCLEPVHAFKALVGKQG